MKSRSFKDLEVWHKARLAAKESVKVAKMLPPEERFELGGQMRRAATSIPSNIAEGQQRGTSKEFANFLKIARGSNAELQTQLYLCVDYEYVSEEAIEYPLAILEDVMKMLNKLIQSLE